MAITGTDRGTNTHNTSGTSFTLSPGSDFSSKNSWAVLCIALDNAGASGGAMATFTVTDSLGNAWTRRTTAIADPGAANAGIEGAIFTCAQNVAILTTGTVITVSFGSSTPTAKAWTLMEITPTQNFRLRFSQGAAGSATTTTSPTVTSASITTNNMIVAALHCEFGTTQVVTQDGDTSNGSWSAQQTTSVGSTTSGACVASQRKVVTGSGTQTYNPTLGSAADAACSWIEITETIRFGIIGSVIPVPL